MTPEMDDILYELQDGKLEELTDQLEQTDFRKALDAITEIEDSLGELRLLIAEEQALRS